MARQREAGRLQRTFRRRMKAQSQLTVLSRLVAWQPPIPTVTTTRTETEADRTESIAADISVIT